MTKSVHIVDDDEAVRDSVTALLAASGYSCRSYASAAEFLQAAEASAPGCALVDVRMPQIDGLALLKELRARGSEISVVIMTGFADVPLAVRAMREGAVDFVEKGGPRDELVAAIERALQRAAVAESHDTARQQARARLERLTDRERDVLDLVITGDANKAIAHKLGISPRTVEIHRGRLMEKAGVKSLAELVRLALAAR